jgi:hypothetical protein
MEISLGIPTLVKTKHKKFAKTQPVLPPPLPTNNIFLLEGEDHSSADFLPWRIKLSSSSELTILHYESTLSGILTIEPPNFISSFSDLITTYRCPTSQMFVMKGSPFLTFGEPISLRILDRLEKIDTISSSDGKTLTVFSTFTPLVSNYHYSYSTDLVFTDLAKDLRKFNGSTINFFNDDREMLIKIRHVGSFLVLSSMKDQGKMLARGSPDILGKIINNTKETGIEVVVPKNKYLSITICLQQDRQIIFRAVDNRYRQVMAVYGNCSIKDQTLDLLDKNSQIAFVHFGIASTFEKEKRNKLEVFTEGSGTYATRGICEFQENIIYRWSKIGSGPLLFYLPPHLSPPYFDTRNIVQVPGVSVRIDNSIFPLVKIIKTNFQLFPRASVKYDIPNIDYQVVPTIREQPEDLSYPKIGDWLYEICQFLLLNRDSLDEKFYSYREMILGIMKNYFSRQGKRESHLYYDDNYGELVDDLGGSDPLSFSNWIFAAAALKYLGDDSFENRPLTPYTKGLLAMLIDGVNPGTSSLTTKLRHRDLYMGTFSELGKRYFQSSAWLSQQNQGIILKSDDLEINFDHIAKVASRCYEIEKAGLLEYRKKTSPKMGDEWHIIQKDLYSSIDNNAVVSSRLDRHSSASPKIWFTLMAGVFFLIIVVVIILSGRRK